ncbi:UPF0175 family protein [Methylorubrum sp. Q1]|uniref:UPF0175 family protein n=1 Tax=Methylorubrum sp. Q1 TaxID=2562453 RepID=UPI00187D3FB9|nr:UPF0175 family protein [Methylorubrum sp. Q1]
MNITVPIPDGLAVRLSAAGEDLARRALEAFALEEYRADRLTEAEMAQLLGFDGRLALDAFLKARGLFLDYDADALDQDRRTLDRLGI